MRGVDDSEDGLNDAAFDRALGATRKTRRRVNRPQPASAALPDPYQWSEQGSTFGIPDRWQMRCVTPTLHVTAGDNRRKSRTEFIRPATETPWHVYERQPDPQTNGTSTKLVEVAGGVATSQELARDAADAAAEYIASKVGTP